MTTEQYKPQVSKREVAIDNLTAYLGGMLAGLLENFELNDSYEKWLRSAATDLYAIVKRAEGFDV